MNVFNKFLNILVFFEVVCLDRGLNMFMLVFSFSVHVFGFATVI